MTTPLIDVPRPVVEHPAVALHRPGMVPKAVRRALLEQLTAVAPDAVRERRMMYGRWVTVPRATYVYGLGYTAASGYRELAPWASSWTGAMWGLLQFANDLTDVACGQGAWRHTGCLVNYYETEVDKVAWHHDAERHLHPGAPILSVTLGASRRFGLRPRGGGEETWLELGDGDVLLMAPGAQEEWEHCVPPESSHRDLRINITFRPYS